MIQLLLGNIGRPGGGVNALRGHANVQGITDQNLITDTLPGYIKIGSDKEQELKAFLEARTPKLLRPNQMNYGQNTPKFFISLMKAWFGGAATAENDFGYHWLPKIDKPYDVLHMFERMHQGQMNGFICQGFNPLAAVSHRAKIAVALSKLKFLVVMDPLATETSEFWRNVGEFNDVKTAEIKTEVFRLPTACFAEDDGTFTNSGRVIAWKEKGADPPGDGRSDREIVARLFLEIRGLYEKEGGAFPEPMSRLTWNYSNKTDPASAEILKEISGYAIADVTDPADATKVLARAGEQVAGFALLRDDGSTACGNWIYSGCFGPTGNLTARRDTADPSALGIYPGWGFAWPANRRILYNRASAAPDGKPFDPSRAILYWNGTKWAGPDVPDMRPNAAPEEGINPFIMCNEGVARLFALGGMAEGPFPEHYEPFESPLERNPLHPDNPKAMNNPATRVFPQDWASFGKPKDFPYAATTYRVTEHFHFWTKHSLLNATTQPEQFVEIGEELAKEKGIARGDRVVVSSNRGEITAVAVVTRRIKPLEVDGKVVHHVGIPIHWGFTGVARKGHLANNLTPFVGDANTQTPEFKAFLVDIEKA